MGSTQHKRDEHAQRSQHAPTGSSHPQKDGLGKRSCGTTNGEKYQVVNEKTPDTYEKNGDEGERYTNDWVTNP